MTIKSKKCYWKSQVTKTDGKKIGDQCEKKIEGLKPKNLNFIETQIIFNPTKYYQYILSLTLLYINTNLMIRLNPCGSRP